MRHDHFVSQLTEQPAYPGGMGSGLQCDETPRYLSKGLLHRLRRRRQLLFQNDLACFIQNTVERPAISEVHTNRELVSFENHVSVYPNSASLFHSRSPFLCALSTSNIGSVSHPAGDRPSHPICEVAFSECGFCGAALGQISTFRESRFLALCEAQFGSL